jgi:hypothetical protein
MLLDHGISLWQAKTTMRQIRFLFLFMSFALSALPIEVGAADADQLNLRATDQSGYSRLVIEGASARTAQVDFSKKGAVRVIFSETVGLPDSVLSNISAQNIQNVQNVQKIL